MLRLIIYCQCVESFLKVVLGILVLSTHNQNEYPCEQALVAIANRYTKHTVRFFALGSDVLSDDSIASVNKPIIFNNTFARQQWRTDTYVVLIPDISSVISFLKKALLTLRTDTPWILGFNGKIQIVELEIVFETCFNRGILEVVAVTTEGLYANVYTYNPFRVESAGGRCYNYNPVLIDVWISREFLHGVDMFSKTKVNNAQSCTVIALMFSTPPYYLYSETSRGLVVTGSGSQLFEALRVKLNFTPVFSLVKDTSFGIEAVRTFPAAIAFGIGNVGQSDISQGTTLGYRCYSWCVPTFVDHVRSWEALINTFSSSVWFSFLVSLLIAVFVIAFFRRYSDQNKSRLGSHPTWLIVWKVVFESPLPAPKETKLRMVFLSLCIFCLVIGTAFKARLHVLMTSAHSVKKMSTLSQVYDSEFELVILSHLMWMMQTVPNETLDKRGLRILDRSGKNGIQMIDKCLSEGTCAILMSDDYCQYTSTRLGKTDEGYNKVHLVPECILTSAGSGFGFSKNSPFRERFKKLTANMWESGMGIKYTSTAFSREIITSEKKAAISLKDMVGVFLIFFVGLAVGACVFVGEIVFRRKETGWFYKQRGSKISSVEEPMTTTYELNTIDSMEEQGMFPFIL